jgi:GTP-binding protein Era
VNDFKCGFIAIVGRPNTGKSTLVNALIGKKVVITSHHPNTTRNSIRGILTSDEYQMILVDTPGVHKPKTLLGNRLNQMVSENVSDVDGAVICLPADEEIGSGDKYLIDQLPANIKIFVALTKIDKVAKSNVAQKLIQISKLESEIKRTFTEIVPISAKHDQLQTVNTLKELLSKSLPVGPALYPNQTKVDLSDEQHIADLIREAAIEKLYEELPHSVMVQVDEITGRKDKDLTKIFASLYVERDSQKGIVIGPKGDRLKEIGTKARGEIETYLGKKVYLRLQVKVASNWQQDPKMLQKLGFTQPVSD